jgi:hypothetical protein
MMAKQKNTSSGIGLLGLVFIAFLVLKLAGIGDVAHWSWWWVTSPLWIPTAVALAIYAGALGFGLIVLILALLFERN